MIIRKAEMSELSAIEQIYEGARAFMRETGNATQWGTVYPPREQIVSDIENGHLYVVLSEGIEAVFAYIPGDDPTYKVIDGSWLNSLPYCAVHRVASAGKTAGMLKAIMDYVFTQCANVKIDTHADNKIMQHQLEKYGFVQCGTIYLENGNSMIAYQMKK